MNPGARLGGKRCDRHPGYFGEQLWPAGLDDACFRWFIVRHWVDDGQSKPARRPGHFMVVVFDSSLRGRPWRIGLLADDPLKEIDFFIPLSPTSGFLLLIFQNILDMG